MLVCVFVCVTMCVCVCVCVCVCAAAFARLKAVVSGVDCFVYFCYLKTALFFFSRNNAA